MAALLAGVAAGFDVRMTNISPIHPALQPQALLKEIAVLKPVMDIKFTSVVDSDTRFAHKTYHGPVGHSRASLTSMSFIPDVRNSRRSDSPQHYQNPSTFSTTSGLGSNFTTNTSAMLSSSFNSHTQSPSPLPRRKISASSFTDNIDYMVGERNVSPSQIYYETPIPNPVYMPTAQRAGYSGSNYFPFQPEENLVYQRDCKSYPETYDSPIRHSRLPSYHGYTYEQQTRTPPPRVPQMGITAAGHRRTPSNVSNSSYVSQPFSLDQNELQDLYRLNALSIQPEPSREVYKESPGRKRIREYENLAFFSGSPSRQASTSAVPLRLPHSMHSTPRRDLSPLVIQERPDSLSFEHTDRGISGNGAKNNLRSSLKKYYRVQNTNGSNACTPNNPTPPDSLTSDDSSYMSAKEGSISSQHSRVRFSPDSFMDVSSPGAHDYNGIIGQESTNLNGVGRRVSRSHISDMIS